MSDAAVVQWTCACGHVNPAKEKSFWGIVPVAFCKNCRRSRQSLESGSWAVPVSEAAASAGEGLGQTPQVQIATADQTPGKIANVFLGVGGVGLVGALLWWASFYGGLMAELDGSLGDAVGCLYSSSGPCGFVAGMAQFAGQTPYSPVLFWAGLIVAGIGGVLKMVAAGGR